jgi:cobalt-precorrin-6B (C15)-methyltransferase
MRWINDEEFIRGSIPMTKFETRIVTIGLLEIELGDVFLDVGAGTGSVSIEAALQGAVVYAIEKEQEGIELITKNAEKFGAKVNVINDLAPSGLDKVPSFNKCFIGGTGGKLKEIFGMVNDKLKPSGIVVANFITLGNLSEFQNLLKQYGYVEIETRLIQSSIVDNKTGLLKAQNPVFIVRGKKS